MESDKALIQAYFPVFRAMSKSMVVLLMLIKSTSTTSYKHTQRVLIFDRTAKDVLAAVQQTMRDHNTTKVTVVGHSLGTTFQLYAFLVFTSLDYARWCDYFPRCYFSPSSYSWD